MSGDNIQPPTLAETEEALWVASYARDTVNSYISTGRPDPEAFISLCSALRKLESILIGGGTIADRADDIHALEMRGK